MKTIFLDTVGLVACWDSTDQWHDMASEAMAQLVSERARLVTTNEVLNECGNTAARTLFRKQVVETRQQLITFDDLFSPTDEEDEEEEQAWLAYERGDAANAGIVDHISFQIMRRLGLTEAFTNDKHFTAAGFTVLF